MPKTKPAAICGHPTCQRRAMRVLGWITCRQHHRPGLVVSTATHIYVRTSDGMTAVAPR